jgi:hypothetical protein
MSRAGAGIVNKVIPPGDDYRDGVKLIAKMMARTGITAVVPD